ncbi:MAG: hypothetical protein WCK60_01805 [Candidatus Nomurabacteria bacterium]
MNKSFETEKIILRYAALKSQSEQSAVDINEMKQIEDKLQMTPNSIMENATRIAISNIK